MDWVAATLGACVGIIIGAAAGWILAGMLRRRTAAGALDGERAMLNERLAQRDQSLRELGERLAAAEQAGRSLNDELRSATARLSAAEERCVRVAALEGEITERDRRIEAAAGELRSESVRAAGLETQLAEERKSAEEKLGLLNDARQKLTEAFQQVSAEALNAGAQSFLELARNRFAELQTAEAEKHTERAAAIEGFVKPLQESLAKVDEKIQALETKREGAYAGLIEQIRTLALSQSQLQTQAGNLVTALRAPQVRGRWGEIQLKRVVELAGMVNYCDFATQVSVDGDGGRLRPDLVVRLPSGKNVVVDSKAPLAAYLDALETQDEAARLSRLRDHAAQIRKHIDQLSGKSYWERLEPTPEFVVLFLPGETFFSAALEQDPSLIEAGVEKQVILATPTTLIALLKAVAYGWRQEQIAENAREISQLGKTLYERLTSMKDHITRLGNSLGRAVDSYNSALGSFEGRVLVSARRFRELGAATGDELDQPEPIEKTPRQLAAAESPPLLSGTAVFELDGPLAPPPAHSPRKDVE